MIKTAEFTSWAIALAIILFVVFQLVVPILKGTIIFPILHPRRKEVYDKLAEACEEKELNDVEETAADILRNATTKPKRR